MRHSRVLFLLSALAGGPLAGCYAEAHTAPVDETVYETAPPPPPTAEVEVVPVAPGPEFFWVPGYHRWNGRQYVWVRGRYERRPHSRAHWVPAHWVVRGRAHVWVEGRWE
ncbi:MAG: hypothetical protein WBY94_04380 [Polyangiaceae bacterium]